MEKRDKGFIWIASKTTDEKGKPKSNRREVKKNHQQVKQNSRNWNKAASQSAIARDDAATKNIISTSIID